MRETKVRKTRLLTLIALAIPVLAHGQWAYDSYELFEGTAHRIRDKSLGVSIVCFPSNGMSLSIRMVRDVAPQLGYPKVQDVVKVEYRVDESVGDGAFGKVGSYVNSREADHIRVELGDSLLSDDEEAPVSVEELMALVKEWFVEDAKKGSLLRVRIVNPAREKGDADREYFFTVPLAGFTAAYNRLPERCR